MTDCISQEKKSQHDLKTAIVATPASAQSKERQRIDSDDNRNSIE